MIDKTWWREEIHDAIVLRKDRRAEMRDRAMNAIKLDVIDEALRVIHKMQVQRLIWADGHRLTIKKARWKNADER